MKLDISNITESQIGCAMAKFLIKFSIFLLPLFIVLGVAVWVAWDLGYAIPLQTMVNLQAENSNILYQPISRSDQFYYKAQAIETHQPKILLIGTSRIANFSSDFVNDPSTFYNAYIGGLNMLEAAWFIDHIDSQYYPEIVILFIELTALNAEDCRTLMPSPPTPLTPLEEILIGTRDLWQDVLLGDFDLNDVYAERNHNPSNWIHLGEYALRYLTFTPTDDDKIRPNVAFDRYGARPNILIDEEDHKIFREEAYRQLEQRESIYQEGRSMIACPPQMEAIDNIITTFQQHGKTVIGVALPYNPIVYENFTTRVAFAYFPVARRQVVDLFAKLDAPYYDFTDPAPFEADALYFSDGHHPSPLLSAQVFYKVALSEQNNFAPYVDLDALKQQIESTTHPYLFSDNVELIASSDN